MTLIPKRFQSGVASVALAIGGILVGAGFVLALATTSCAWDKFDPQSTAPRPGLPCGNVGVACTDQDNKSNGACCMEGETCGGGKYEVGCPVGMCCDIREIPLDGNGHHTDKWPDAGVPLGADVTTTVMGKQRPASP